jgi:hypothetical protein
MRSRLWRLRTMARGAGRRVRGNHGVSVPWPLGAVEGLKTPPQAHSEARRRRDSEVGGLWRQLVLEALQTPAYTCTIDLGREGQAEGLGGPAACPTDPGNTARTPEDGRDAIGSDRCPT